MLSRSQVLTLVLLSVALWIAATLYIRLLPSALLDPMIGGLSFLTTFPLAWLSILIIRTVAALRADELIAGVSVVGAVAMMIDGAVLHWWPATYGESETVVRLGAAWLLWGYGVSLGIALLMAGGVRRPTRWQTAIAAISERIRKSARRLVRRSRPHRKTLDSGRR